MKYKSLKYNNINKMIFSKNSLIVYIFGYLFLISGVACQRINTDETTPQSSVENTLVLLDWLEKTGNYVQSKQFPAIMDAQVVYTQSEENILVIDLRNEEDFIAGHIEYAVNVAPAKILEYFTAKIDPASFKSIVFVCNNGMVSGYVTGVMRLLGYNNTFSMRYGMSAWDRIIAGEYWLANTGNNWETKLEPVRTDLPVPGNLPAIEGSETDGFQLARLRAAQMLGEEISGFLLSNSDYSENSSAWFTICYWPPDKCTQNGGLPGSFHYEPRKSLDLKTNLRTLPVDKPIVVYCHTGQQSSFLAAYLRMVGYDAYSLAYGANGFIHNVMGRIEPSVNRTFTEKAIMDLPLVKNKITEPKPQQEGIGTEKTTVTGGC